MAKHAKPILDLETGKEYTSMYKAGQELAPLVSGDPKNQLVWFAIARAFPNRFQTKDPETGAWIPLKAAARKARVKKVIGSRPASAAIVLTTQPAASEPSTVQQGPAAIAKQRKHAPKPKRSSTGTRATKTAKPARKKSHARKSAEAKR